MTSATKQTLSGGQAAVEALRNEKTQHVFGLIGSATMEMFDALYDCLLYTSPSPRDLSTSRMPSSA